ncbi:MAG: LysM peptidoglycan-binding domain-containing protein [Kiritimatiellia bacterium]|jgi:LysM repeat protein|uniref:LysM peptidoglycan-binding domain-containing protein n=1 Tax=Atribacter sp. TaxID=2847780 RepID=UPI003D9864C5
MKHHCNAFAFALLALVAAGCVTTDETGRTVLGSPRGSGYRQPSPREVEEARREARMVELESSVRRLQAELDSVGSSINTVSQKADSSMQQSASGASDAASLRAEIASLRRDVESQNAALKAIPASFSKLLEENNRALMADVDARIKAAAARRNTGSSRPSGSGKFYEHEVEAGQTLSVIAREYGVTMNEIMQENNIRNPELIRVGDKLLIPVR